MKALGYALLALGYGFYIPYDQQIKDDIGNTVTDLVLFIFFAGLLARETGWWFKKE